MTLWADSDPSGMYEYLKLALGVIGSNLEMDGGENTLVAP